MTFDSKWQMRNGQFIGFRVQPSNMWHMDGKNKIVASSLLQVQADASVSKRVKRVFYTGYVNTSYQKNVFPINTGAFVYSTSFAATTMHSFTVGTKIFYLNLSGNYTRQSEYLFLIHHFLRSWALPTQLGS